MESFSELLTDVFSETSGPSFAGEDLDFENLNFDGNCEEDEAERVTRRRDRALLQEATGETAALPDEEAEDELYLGEKEHVDDESGEEDFQEDDTSSEGESDEEGSSSGDDEEEEDDVAEPGELLVSVRCTDEVFEKENRIFAEGQPLAPGLVEGDGDETGESDSYSSSDYDDDVNVRRSSDETSVTWGQRDPERRNQPEDTRLHGGSRTMFCSSDDRLMSISRVNPADLLGWDFHELKPDRFQSEFVLTTEDTHQTETHTSGVNRRHTDDDNSYSMVKREDIKSPSSQGSLDDSFFFNAGVETSGVTEQGNNEYEEERNWEQEQERIKAFYDYYDDSDEENEREGRQPKVQFCADPLSQIIHYETDSSDGDSLSSSTDREDDQSSADTSDELVEPGDMQQLKPECDPLTAQLQDSELNIRNTHTRARQHRCVTTMKLMLKMSLVLVAGLLMFWLATDEADWLHQVSIF